MKTNLTYFLFPIILFLACCKDTKIDDPKREVLFLDNTKIIFASLEDAKTLLGTSDEYTQKLSPFELKAKTHNINASDESDYLHHAALQAKE